jgi:hypothetical protein
MQLLRRRSSRVSDDAISTGQGLRAAAQSIRHPTPVDIFNSTGAIRSSYTFPISAVWIDGLILASHENQPPLSDAVDDSSLSRHRTSCAKVMLAHLRYFADGTGRRD